MKTGRLVGALLFVQLLGLIVPFTLLAPAVTPRFLQEMPAHSAAVRVAVVLFILNGIVTIAIAIVMSHALREKHLASLLALFAASIIWFLLQSIDDTLLLTMLASSENAAPEAVGLALRRLRMAAHYTALLSIEAWFFTFYFTLLRARLVPVLLAMFALLMPVIHAIGISGAFFLGYKANFMLAFSLLLSHLLIAGWLAVKGFVLTAPRP